LFIFQTRSLGTDEKQQQQQQNAYNSKKENAENSLTSAITATVLVETPIT